MNGKSKDIIANLIALNFSPYQVTTYHDWNDQFFKAETCARHFYLGQSSMKADIPDEVARNFVGNGKVDKKIFNKPRQLKALEGIPAYTMLLKVLTGTERENRVNEYNIKSEIKRAFEEYNPDNPLLKKFIGKSLSLAYEDTKMIRNDFLTNLIGVSNNAINNARLAVSMPKDQTVAYFSKGNLEADIIAIKALGYRANKLKIFISGNLETPKTIFEETAKQRGVNLEILSPNDLSNNLKGVNYIFVASKMGTTSYESELVDVWSSSHNSRQGKIIHLAGTEGGRFEVSGEWNKIIGKGLVPFSEIMTFRKSAIEKNNKLLGIAHEAIELVSNLRGNNIEPRKAASYINIRSKINERKIGLL